jgi:hypothetical protein
VSRKLLAEPVTDRQGRTPQTWLHAISESELEVPVIVITTPTGQIGRQVLGNQRTPQNSTPTSFRQWCEEVLKPAVAS